MRRTDQWLLGCFAVTMAVYTAAFTAAFSDLPLNIPPWHQLLLLYFHAFPMFFLQLLLCRRARAVWRLLVPLALLAVPGVLFLSAAGWMVMGWHLSHNTLVTAPSPHPISNASLSLLKSYQFKIFFRK